MTIRPRTTLLFLVPMAIFPLPTTAIAASQQQGLTDSYLRMVWGLLVVIGIIFVIYALVKKRFSLLTGTAKQHIEVVEIKPLFGKNALCLVRVKGQEFLVGISSERITHIATVNDMGSSLHQSSFAQTLHDSLTDTPS